MKRYFLSAIISFLFASQIVAQENQAAKGTQPAGSFTLEECIQYALENSINVVNAGVDQDIAKARVKETRGIGLPQVDGKVQLIHNEKLQRFFNSYAVAQGFSGGALPDVPGVEPGDIVALGSPFQLKNSGDASLSISQILFNGSYLVGLKAAATYRELSERAMVRTKEETISQVMKAYYGVLINRDRMELFESNIARFDTLLRTTRAMNENGFAESIDVDRIRVSLNNLIVEREKFSNLQELSLLQLKFQMNYPMDQPINVDGDLSEITVSENVLAEYESDWDFKQRSDYMLLETNRDLQALNLKNKYATGMPSLVAFANLGYSTQSPTVSGLFKTETPMTNIEAGGAAIGPDRWYGYSLFGLTLNVPIFSGLQRTYQIQQAKLELLKVENQFTTLNAGIQLEIQQAATVYRNSIESLKAQHENRELASNVARVTKIKYEEGVGLNTEVIDAESSLKEAQVNYYNALYLALIAKVELDMAYGKLNRTPIERK